MVGIGIGSHEPGRAKDTRRNIRNTSEFVVNLVSEDMAEAMNITAIEFEPEVNETIEAQLETISSVHVKPPRIAASPVSMECALIQIVELGPDNGLVLGKVLAMHVRDDLVIDPRQSREHNAVQLAADPARRNPAQSAAEPPAQCLVHLGAVPEPLLGAQHLKPEMEKVRRPGLPSGGHDQ